jgi:predicted N-acetyltransferase YhbS
MTDPRPVIRPMRAEDLAEADRVYRVAFGTQFGLPDPSRFRGDTGVLRVRWAADPRPCFVAEADGRIIGSVLGMDWGSVFVLGPLTVDPAYADRGIGRRLMQAVMDFVAVQRFALAALFTFPHSPKHLHLYESYGFVPQRLTPVLSKMVTQNQTDGLGTASPPSLPSPSRGEGPGGGDALRADLFSNITLAERAAALAACRAVSDSVFPGLDLAREIAAIAAQRIGETVLLHASDAIAGFALCHIGAGSEAGSGTLFIKFACVRPGDAGGFARLVAACEALAAARGGAHIVAGVNRGRDGAYRLMRERGFRADLIGVAMHRPDGPGYNRPQIYAIDDWR